MKAEKQLDEWVAGNPVHNTENDECCPDFSCCTGNIAPKMAVSKSELPKMGAIDPGPTESAFLVWDGKTIIKKDILENNVLLSLALAYRSAFPEFPLVIEKVVSYGMTVGASTFETVYWTGRFCQAWPGPHFRVPRLVVKQHLCHDSRAKDTNIRQALVDRFACGQKNNGKGTKKAPGFFYGVKTHLWQALALAVTFYDQNIEKNDVI